MNFTYHQPDEVIIMGTSRQTTKFKHLEESQTVAILIHDFPHLVTNKGDAYAESFNTLGKAEITREGSDAESTGIFMCLPIRLCTVFSKGAIVMVRVEKARLCDIHDEVTNWEAPRSLP